MARISMRNVQKSTVEEYFSLYLSSAAAKGVKDKTLETYKNHFSFWLVYLPCLAITFPSKPLSAFRVIFCRRFHPPWDTAPLKVHFQ